MVSALYVLGIDLGTTTCRCAIFAPDGTEVVAAYRETTVDYPRLLWAEVEPEAWWRCTIEVVREALARSGVSPEHIAGIGVSGLMHAPVLLDSDGQPVAPAMLWMDQRCAPQCDEMNREHRARAPIGAFAPFTTSLTAPKLRWLAEARPEALARAHMLLLPKDFVRFRLTGAICTDRSDAEGTGLLHADGSAWDPELAWLARVSPALLPPIRPAWAAAGPLTPAAARETGLRAGTTVAVGGGDTGCTLMGGGELGAREVCIYLGTAAWIALVDGQTPDGLPAIGGFGSTATTGAALRWVRDLLVSEIGADISASYDALTGAASAIAPGAEGLLFLPHLMGERGPTADPMARGALVGLTLRHSRPQMIRAILEGTAFHLRRVLDTCTREHWPDGWSATAVACGGVARSPFWMQLLADVTGVTLRVPDVAEAAVLGAAMLGGMAAGVLPRDGAIRRMAHTGRTYRPDPVLAARYDALHARYCRLDDLLAPWFHEGGPAET